MRIAFAIFKYFPFGGIQRDLMKVIRELQRRGHEVSVFTLRWDAPPPEDLKVYALPLRGLSRHAQYDHFAEQVNAHVAHDPPDLLVGFNKMPGLDVYYAGDSCYILKSLTQRPPAYRLLPRYKRFVAAERAVFETASHAQILTLSDIEVPAFRHHYGTPPERFHPLPPGIERDRVAPPDHQDQRAAFRSALGVADDEHMVLFVGSGFIKKGLDRALLAIAALPDDMAPRVKFFVVGKDNADPFERLAMRLGISAQVTFFAEGRDDIAQFYFAADLLLHPAYDELAGMVLLEAMLAGLPVLTTRNCGYAHYISSREAGVVLPEPFSQQTLNQALVDALTSAQREHWITNGLGAGRDEHFFGMVPTFADIIESMARDARPLLAFCVLRHNPADAQGQQTLQIVQACLLAGFRAHIYCIDWQGPVPEGCTVERVALDSDLPHVAGMQLIKHIRDRVRWLRAKLLIGFSKLPGLDLYLALEPCYVAGVATTWTQNLSRHHRQKVAYERAVFDPQASTQILLHAAAWQAQYQAVYLTPEPRFTLLDEANFADQVAESITARLVPTPHTSSDVA